MRAPLRLAVWNVLPAAREHAGPADSQALAADCASLDADVFALQEVDREQARSGGFAQLALMAGEQLR